MPLEEKKPWISIRKQDQLKRNYVDTNMTFIYFIKGNRSSLETINSLSRNESSLISTILKVGKNFFYFGKRTLLYLAQIHIALQILIFLPKEEAILQ